MRQAERILVQASASLAAAALDARYDLRPILAAAGAGCRAEEVEEILLQGYLFLGFPAVLDAFSVWREVVPASEAEAHPLEPGRWLERGADASTRVYGDQIDRLRANVRALHPDLERWMIAEGYGKVLSRPGVELRVRELCIVGLIAVLARPRQLYSHLRGALRVGAAMEDVKEALSVAASLSSQVAVEVASEVWEQVVATRESS